MSYQPVAFHIFLFTDSTGVTCRNLPCPTWVKLHWWPLGVKLQWKCTCTFNIGHIGMVNMGNFFFDFICCLKSQVSCSYSVGAIICGSVAWHHLSIKRLPWWFFKPLFHWVWELDVLSVIKEKQLQHSCGNKVYKGSDLSPRVFFFQPVLAGRTAS